MSYGLRLRFILLVLWAQAASATTLTVTDLGDGGAGTLRQAIADAAPGDTIEFAVTGTVEVTSGELTVDRDLVVNGPGAAALRIEARNHRVWHVVAGVLHLSGVTVARGFDENRGGGAYVEPGAALRVRDCVFTENSLGRPDHSGPATVAGAAVYNGGTLDMARCTVRTNSARGALGYAAYIDATGGGLYNAANATATIEDSTFERNSAAGSDTGSGLSAGTGSGGGIGNAGTLLLRNSTLSDNRASGGVTPFFMDGAGFGGGLSNGGAATVEFCTLTANVARTGGLGGTAVADGGGLHQDATGSIVLHGTLVAENVAVVSCAPPSCSLQSVLDDCNGSVVSNGHNLIGTGVGCAGPIDGINGDLVGGAGAAAIDPDLGPLADNGGPTPTHALCTGEGAPDPSCAGKSPAIDAVPPAECTNPDGSPLTTDQRGVRRPQGPACDIGAYEGARPATACPGDCFADDTVTIDDIVILVNIALGSAQPAACPAGIPPGTPVDIGLIIQAVNHALTGCSRA